MNPTIIVAAISAALAGSIGFGAAWTLQGRNIDELKLGAANDRITQQRETRRAIERASENVREAQESASARIAVLGRELADVRKSADGLRDSSSAAVRTATDSPATCASIVNAFNVIQLESSGFVEEVARDADQCLSNLQLMHEAWPKN